MRIGLVSYECRNNDPAFNLSQIEKALRTAEGKADLLCFGEAFLQGFDCLSWSYEQDAETAAEQSSDLIGKLADLSVKYGTALLCGYIEKEADCLYSSCIVLSQGKIVHNYRRISKGWKECAKTDDHYCEGTTVESFRLHGMKMTIALCGDLWEFPERFITDGLLVWPVYVSYDVEEWENGILEEYAGQAGHAAGDTLMVNPIDRPQNHGGSFRFLNGRVNSRIPFDREGILFVSVDDSQNLITDEVS